MHEYMKKSASSSADSVTIQKKHEIRREDCFCKAQLLSVYFEK